MPKAEKAFLTDALGESDILQDSGKLTSGIREFVLHDEYFTEKESRFIGHGVAFLAGFQEHPDFILGYRKLLLVHMELCRSQQRFQ